MPGYARMRRRIRSGAADALALFSQSFVRRILKHSDQQCSLFLQQKVKSTTPEKRQEIFDAVGKHICELSFSKFGAFKPSRLLELGQAV